MNIQAKVLGLVGCLALASITHADGKKEGRKPASDTKPMNAEYLKATDDTTGTISMLVRYTDFEKHVVCYGFTASSSALTCLPDPTYRP